MSRHTRAIINLSHIKSNFKTANQWAPDSKNMAIIKANAYGHGLIETAKSLEPLVPAFGVAIFEEAIALRDSGIKKDILVLQGVSSVDDLLQASEKKVWLTIHNPLQLKLVLENPQNNKVTVWLKLDTGMHRLGFDHKDLILALKQLKKCQWVDELIVISSHFSCASEINNEENQHQVEAFNATRLALAENKNIQFSLSNSPAIVSLPNANFDWNRPGIMLYGLPLFDGPHSSDQQLYPAMTFESRIIGLRKVNQGEYVGYGQGWRAERNSKIATVEVGYADGYPRQAKTGTPVLVNGVKAGLVGVVSMDLISIDVTDIPDVSIGDLVELWGEQLCANEVASYADTIGYDLISSVSQRVPRIFLE